MHLIAKILTFLMLVMPAQSFAGLVISEFQPAPAGDEPEWIEIYNHSDESIDLAGWQICDMKNCKTFNSPILPAGHFAVIAKDFSQLSKKYSIPSSAVLIEMAFPGLNNTSDELRLINPQNKLIDSVYYDMADYSAGVSIERIDLLSKLIEDNWTNCIHPSGGTPGSVNSVAISQYDIAASSIELIGDILKFTCSNLGKSNIENAVAYLSIDGAEVKNLEFSLSAGEIYTGHILLSELEQLISSKSSFLVHLKVSHHLDSRADNDTISRFFFTATGFTLSINEIMFDVESDNAEFVEIYNPSETYVSLAGITLRDEAAPPDKAILIDESLGIFPRAYFVIAWDEAIYEAFPYLRDSGNVFISKTKINLNNSGDVIYIAAENGELIDSLTFSAKWHHKKIDDVKNVSLEKINPNLPAANADYWTSSTDALGGTPARKNSASQEIAVSAELKASPNPFKPHSKNEICLISYKLPYAKSSLRATIFDAAGYEVRELSNNYFVGSGGTLSWDGRNGEGSPLPRGAYVVYFEAADADSNAVISEKIVLVIGD